MTSRFCRNALIIAFTGGMSSCTVVSPYQNKVEEKARVELAGSSLAEAQQLLKRAVYLDRFDEASMVYRLRAAEIAWGELAARGGRVRDASQMDKEEKLAVKIINESQDKLAPMFADDEERTKTFSYAGLTYQITVPAPKLKGEHDPHEFDLVRPVSKVKETLCKKKIVTEGVGSPLVAHWKRPTDPKKAQFVSSVGYLLPVTATLNFSEGGGKQARTATLTYSDPTTLITTKVGKTEYPLAADFTTPIAERTAKVKELWLGLAGVFRPLTQNARLGMLEPYDPNKIPVIMVHGLLSHPRMWRDVYNELRSDPDLKGKFQFWSFHYPTGWPILYSAMRFREELAEFDKVFGRQHNEILIGHSMGGLVSQLQAVSPGRKIWDANLKEDADAYFKRLPANHLQKRMMLFERNPDISRLIFICVPHRGSDIADWSIVKFIGGLIRLPATIVATTLDVPLALAKGSQLNGITRLSPKNPTYAAMDQTPIPVPYHSIIGDRGKGDSPKSSDGAVPYWSSHLDGAQSELIVPGGHGSYDHPLTLAELKRILLLQYSQRKR